MTSRSITVVGAGLAGSECAFQLAEAGFSVTLVEQKPKKRTPAQSSDYFAELVCSNSFRGAALTNAVGLLKEEMRRSGSLVIRLADETKVPAGGALAVDRDRFGPAIEAALRGHPRISVVCEEVVELPASTAVIATGPLTGDRLARAIADAVGSEHLAYYDAIAPIVAADSIDRSKVFRASRWDKGGDDAYVNCPMTREEYDAFVAAVLSAEKVAPHSFEDVKYFEGCLPLEVMAERGPQTLSFGPMKPVGLTDPATGKRPFAVVQLRQEDVGGTAFNLVGFQTRMTWPEQKRVFGMIPGLANAEWLRLGSVHRNTFVRAPDALDDRLALRARPHVHLAGQITGVEGYLESAACGFVLAKILAGGLEALPPPTTALGALYGHLRRATDSFQPSNVLWSMFPPIENLPRKIDKRARYELMAERALSDLAAWRERTSRAA